MPTFNREELEKSLSYCYEHLEVGNEEQNKAVWCAINTIKYCIEHDSGYQNDNAPTIDDLSEYSDKLWKQAYERGKAEERPTGHWVYTYTNGFGNKIGHCSICKYSSEYHNFCPNCRALMVKEAEK